MVKLADCELLVSVVWVCSHDHVQVLATLILAWKNAENASELPTVSETPTECSSPVIVLLLSVRSFLISRVYGTGWPSGVSGGSYGTVVDVWMNRLGSIAVLPFAN